jgi:carbamoyltransferase
MFQKTIAIYGSHDSSFTFIDNSGQLRIFEVERFTKQRYSSFSKRFDTQSTGINDQLREDFINMLKERLFDKDITTVLYEEVFEDDFIFLRKHFPNANFVKWDDHHKSHAYSAIQNSGFEDSIILSIDGSGINSGSTKVFDYQDKKLSLIDNHMVNLGQAYTISTLPLVDITHQNPKAELLSAAGKFMGICAYGDVIEDWIAPFHDFYLNFINSSFEDSLRKLTQRLKLEEINFDRIYENESFNLTGVKVLTGKKAYDFAATSQFVFEKIVLSLVEFFVDKYNKNVILTGGCALNVLANQKIFEYLNKRGLSLYVPPNPSDCGISYGMWMSYFTDFESGETCFSGIEILDEDKIEVYENNHAYEPLTYESVVGHLKAGKIIGIIDGNSEVGPRALGNRSIICDPSYEGMKDILNSKVKFREWFRPFAPVCTDEYMETYFENAFSSKYMTYAPKVKEEFRKLLPSITHADGTSRLQTVHSDGSHFHSILTELKRQGHIPVILNTSFNIKGRPILTSLEDAFYVLDNTQLDLLIHNGKIYSKKD